MLHLMLFANNDSVTKERLKTRVCAIAPFVEREPGQLLDTDSLCREIEELPQHPTTHRIYRTYCDKLSTFLDRLVDLGFLDAFEAEKQGRLPSITTLQEDNQKLKEQLRKRKAEFGELKKHGKKIKKELADTVTQLAEKNTLLQQKETELTTKDTLLQQKETELTTKDTLLQQQETELTKKDTLLQQKETELTTKDTLLRQKDTEQAPMIQQKEAELEALRQQKETELAALRQQKETELEALRQQKNTEVLQTIVTFSMSQGILAKNYNTVKEENKQLRLTNG